METNKDRVERGAERRGSGGVGSRTQEMDRETESAREGKETWRMTTTRITSSNCVSPPRLSAEHFGISLLSLSVKREANEYANFGPTPPVVAGNTP